MPDRLLQGADPLVTTGAFYLILIPITVFMIIYEEMVREKANNLRMGLLLIGCSNTAYWASWTLTGVMYSAIMSTLMYLFGYAFHFSLFVNSPFYTLFLMMFSVSLCEISFAFLLMTLMPNQQTALTMCYTFILVSVITTMALIDTLAVYKLFYNLDMPEWAVYFRYAFEFLPSFHFTKMYGDVSRITCFHLSVENLLWLPGRDYNWEDMFTDMGGQFMTKDRYLVPSMWKTLVKLS